VRPWGPRRWRKCNGRWAHADVAGPCAIGQQAVENSVRRGRVQPVQWEGAYEPSALADPVGWLRLQRPDSRRAPILAPAKAPLTPVIHVSSPVGISPAGENEFPRDWRDIRCAIG
jgi:hypothetical protein